MHELKFVFFTDAHWSENDKCSKKIIEDIVNKEIADIVIFGGDVIADYEESLESAEQKIITFRREFYNENYYFFPVVGNHDYNSYNNKNVSSYLTTDQIINLNYVYTKHGETITKGPHGGYYFDIKNYNIRLIVLNTCLDEKQKIEEQEKFLCEALCSLSNSQRVIVVSHIFLEWDCKIKKHVFSPKAIGIINILDSYKSRVQYDEYDYSNSNGVIVMMLGGHIHVDRVDYSKTMIPIITTDCDCFEKSYSHVERAADNSNDCCVTLFEIGKSIKLERFGRKNQYFISNIEYEGFM